MLSAYERSETNDHGVFEDILWMERGRACDHAQV